MCDEKPISNSNNNNNNNSNHNNNSNNSNGSESVRSGVSDVAGDVVMSVSVK